MIFQVRMFQGARYSLFNYNTSGAPGGYADFDRFTVDEPHPSGLTRPIPAGKSIVLENMLDDSLLAIKGDALATGPKSDKLASTGPAQFKVMGLPFGRVSLRSVLDNRLVTVSGLGEASRVSLEPARADDDSQAFQWWHRCCRCTRSAARSQKLCFVELAWKRANDRCAATLRRGAL